MTRTEKSKFPLSYVERLTIHELLQKNVTYRSIGDAIQRHEDTVSQELKRNGGAGNYCPHKAQEAYEKRILNARERSKEVYSDEEKDALEDCIRKGFTRNKTSVQSGISYFRVSRYIQKYHKGYQPSSDQKKHKKMSLESRVTSIEMQIEILLEKIKELSKCQK